MSDKTSLSDLARQAGFVLVNGQHCRSIASPEDLEKFAALHRASIIAELCADAEPLRVSELTELMRHVHRIELHAMEWARWYADCDPLIKCDMPPPPSGTRELVERLTAAKAASPWPVYSSTTVAALQARVAELGAALSDLLDAERFSNRPPETVMQAEEKLDRIRSAAAKAHEALRSKK